MFGLADNIGFCWRALVALGNADDVTNAVSLSQCAFKRIEKRCRVPLAIRDDA